MVTPLKFIYASIYISDIFVLTVSFNVINSFFLIFPLFRESFTDFTSCIVQISSIFDPDFVTIVI